MSQPPASAFSAGELLYGAKAIAAFLGITRRQCHYLKEKGVLPCWSEGRTLVAQRSAVQAWIEQRAATGQSR